MVEAAQWNNLSGGLPLYRGFSRKLNGASVQIVSPENRSPVNMPPQVQVEIDDWFEAHFKVRYRQRSIFATGSLDIANHYAGEYGEVRILRPILSAFAGVRSARIFTKSTS